MNIRVAAFVTVLLAVCTGQAQAQDDHLECYKIKDPLKLEAFVDLTSPQFGLAPNCKVGQAKFFCAPAEKTVISAQDKATKLPITPLPVSGPNAGDRICYKVKCPEPFPADQLATDQFGTRTFTKFKTQLLCTPAVKGGVPPRFVDNGNSITDNSTGLQWVETNNLDGVADYGNPQDADNLYTWGGLSGCTFTGCANGSAFRDYLSRLNFCSSADGSTAVFAGFAAHCDWRLPTVQELKTILDLTQGICGGGSGPCIDPIFGPTAADLHWSATTHASFSGSAWDVNFNGGIVDDDGKNNFLYVRAVRAGP